MPNSSTAPRGDDAADPGHNGGVSTTDDILEAKRRRRRAGDPRITPKDREILLRLTTGDLMDEFQAALDADLEADPILGGHDTDDD